MSSSNMVSEYDADAIMSTIMNSLGPEPDPIDNSHNRQKKRKHSDGSDEEEEEEEEEEQGNVILPVPTRNIIERVKRHADVKRLKPEQKAEVEQFVQEPILVQIGNIFVNQLAAQNEKANAAAAAPSFTVTAELSDNAFRYAAAVLLSPKLRMYKGDAPKDLVLEVIKRKRFGLYDGIERNATDWEKVKACVANALTQVRAALKKLLRSSLEYEVKVDSPQLDKNGKPKKISQWRPHEKESQQNLYSLTQAMVQHAGSTMASAAVCGRVALMRLQYRAGHGDDYWDLLDTRLRRIFKDTKEDPLYLRQFFDTLVEQDRQSYGIDDDFILPEGESEFQVGVDELLAAQAANTSLT